MDTIGFVFGMSGFMFGMLGFVLATNAISSCNSAADRIGNLERRLHEAGIPDAGNSTE